ncbi:78f2980b-1ddc-4e61-84cc-5aa77627a876 [Thermothielavioides terrestris]|uniref:Small ribosomal subunit protein uS11m n=2 Tax=Thermothielavioides terrestris TaxID=2587410 RepID=G2RDV3_THETT|nr:uncharacterized protein THITE_2120876 [Thermothielavioides terrestris NRRL 8126]AEO70034.1 hypothetical protein THITE_2120876 [Thermothielavioides terrestris NRRL 8126]SPQ17834.1 78f2980b-1ddc-4e61-84cc-5aa77627a876 [Thermothielavioides terrestris]
MSRLTIGRLLAPALLRPLSKPTGAANAVPQWARLFSQSRATASSIFTSPPQQPAAQQDSNPMNRLATAVLGQVVQPTNPNAPLSEELGIEEEKQSKEPYHFHIYSHKHNTHVTLTKPNRDALISLSCGNLGFKKSARKNYDAAYQLGAYVIDKMHQKGLTKQIHKLEVVLRGFGPGREAVVKVLMGNEGKYLRPKIVRVSDATRLKFGGTRSKRKRRLG